MASVATLYTPDVLALATGLAGWRIDDALPYRGTARSASCGSTLTVGFATDAAGLITQIGVSAQACAIGQASAAIMVGAAIGRSITDIARAESDIANWLAGEGALPDWPGLAAIAPARGFPGRHGAILLAWRAVLAARVGAGAPN